MDAVQLDFFAEDPHNRPWLLSAIGEGVQNDCGVYTDNVLDVVPYDGNLKNYPKETKDLLKLCRKLCDRIAKEVA